MSGEPLFQYQQLAGGALLEGHNFPAEPLSWAATYPSRIVRIPLRTAATPSFFFYPLPLPPAPPPDGPPPGPPFKPRKEALGGGASLRLDPSQQQFFATAFSPVLPIPGVTSWLPQRPDANPIAARSWAHTSMASGAFVYQIPLPTQTPVEFPDTVERPSLRTSDHQSFAGPWMSALDPPEPAWIPVYPEFITRHTIPTTAHPAFMQGPFTPILPVPALSWHPTFADQVWTTTLPAAAMQMFVLDVEPIVNPAAPDLSWHPVYPDAIDPLERLRAALQQTWASNYEPIAPPAVPELSWGPQMPPWIRDLARERSVELLTRVTTRYDPAPQSISWQATYADTVTRTAQVTPRAWFSSPLDVALASVAWVPHHPDRLPPLTLPAETQTTFDVGNMIAIAATGAWRPHFPIPSYATWVLAAVTSASDIPPLQGPWPCVHLRIDDQTSTRLLSLAGTVTGLLETEQTATALINLDVC